MKRILCIVLAAFFVVLLSLLSCSAPEINPLEPVHAAAFSMSSVSSVAKSTGATLDLDRLALAIAMKETSNCRAGVGKSKNNCHGITKKGGGFIVFETTEDSFVYFKEYWMRKYKVFPTLEIATIYVCGGTHLKKYGTVPCKGGNPEGWLKDVVKYYKMA